MKKRRFLAILLAALLMFGAVSAQALADDADAESMFAAKIIYTDTDDDPTYITDPTEIGTTLSGLSQNATVTLLKDITVTRPITIDNGSVDITLDLNGHRIEADEDPYWNDDRDFVICIKSGNVTITGDGTIDTKGVEYGYDDDKYPLYGIEVRDATCTIENGTFTAANIVVSVQNNGTLWINGGKLTGGASETLFISSINVDGVTTWNGEITVTGGEFVGYDPSKFVADGYKATLTDGKYSVSKLTADDAVASVTANGETTYYASLQSAADAAKEAVTPTITLLKDVELTSPLVLTKTDGSSDMTLDLNGKKIYTTTGWDPIKTSENDCFLIHIHHADVTITGNGTVSAKVSSINAAYGILVSDNGKCTIENGTFEAEAYVVRAIKGNSPAWVQINGGKFKSPSGKKSLTLSNYQSTIIVTGGEFYEFDPRGTVADPTGFVPTGCTVSEKDSDGYYTVSCGENKVLLLQGDSAVGVYKTVEAAMAAVTAGEIYTIDLLGNSVELTQGVTVSGCSNLTIKNGTLTGEELENVFTVEAGTNVWEANSLMLEDCTLNFTDVKGSLLTVEQYGNLHIYDCEITATGTDTAYGISFEGDYADLSDSTVELSGFAVGLYSNSANFTITDCELTITGCGEWDLLLENGASIGPDNSKVTVGKMIAYNGDGGGNAADDDDIDPTFGQNSGAALLIDTKGGQIDLCEFLENICYGNIDFEKGVTLTAPTRSGYKFEGWYSDEKFKNKITELKWPEAPVDEPVITAEIDPDGTGEIDPATTTDYNLTAYAKWSSTSGTSGNHGHKTYYTVTFDSNGGSKVANQSVKKNSTASEPTAPTKSGYSFAGWYSDSKLTDKFDFDTKITKATRLWAKWDEESGSGTGTGTETKPGTGGSNSYCIILTLDKYEALVYGETKLNDVTPLAVNNRVMMPTRFVAENLFCTVHWDRETGIITISGTNFVSGASMEIILTVNSNTATVNGKTVTLDSTTFVQNNRIYTPLRFVAETLGATVDWNSSTKKITVTLPATTISDELIATLKTAK